jgi:hypothetical protein
VWWTILPYSRRCITIGDTLQNSGIPKIGDKKSTHQARFHSSLINHSPNLVLKLAKFRSSELIRIHPNHQIWLFGCPKNQIFSYLVIQMTQRTKFGYSDIQRKLKKPNLAINLEVRERVLCRYDHSIIWSINVMWCYMAMPSMEWSRKGYFITVIGE